MRLSLRVGKTTHIWEKKQNTANCLRSNVCDSSQSSRSLQHLKIKRKQLDWLVLILLCNLEENPTQFPPLDLRASKETKKEKKR